MVTVRLRVELEEVPGKGWVAHADEARATAQGETVEEALANLRELLEHYPEVLTELLDSAKATGPQLELVTA